jgi:transmembrane sensor
MSSANVLRFDNTPLSQVLPALEKLFGKQILLNDTLAAQKRLTLNLGGESLESALQVICASLDLEYVLKDGKYVLEKRDTSNRH